MTRTIAGSKISLNNRKKMRGFLFYKEEEVLMAKKYEDFFRSEADGLDALLPQAHSAATIAMHIMMHTSLLIFFILKSSFPCLIFVLLSAMN